MKTLLRHVVLSLAFFFLFIPLVRAGDDMAAVQKSTPTPPPPQGIDGWWNGPSLTEDWFQQGDTLRQHGVYLIGTLNQYEQGLVSGTGNNEFEYGGKLDGILHLEGEQMGTWKGLSLDSHLEFLYGNNALLHGGVLSPVNTALLLPTPGKTTVTLSSLFLTQKFGDQFSLSVGRFNTIDFGYASPYDGGSGNTFWNTSFVVPLVEAKTLPPVTNGVLMKFDTKHDVDLTFAVFDPQQSMTTTGLPNLFDNGVTLMGDVSVKTKFFNQPGKQSVTTTWSDLTSNSLGQLPEVLLPQVFGTPSTRQGTWSVNYHFEQALYVPKDAPTQAVGLFGDVGVTDGNPNPIKWSATAGIGGHSPIPGRGEDRIGIGYYYLGLSDAFKNQPLLTTRLRDEQGAEMFYTASINKWWTVTADLQVIDPASVQNDTDVVLGFEAGIKF